MAIGKNREMRVEAEGLLWLVLGVIFSLFLIPTVAFAQGQGLQQKAPPANFHKLSLKDFIHLVAQRNEQILSESAQWVISKEDVRAAESIFEPTLDNSYQYSHTGRRNTVQERVSLANLPYFKENRNSYQVAVEGLLPIGTRLRLGYNLDTFHNTLDDIYGDGINREYQTFMGVSFTQPLLKGAGKQATMAGIRAAKEDADVGFQLYRMQMFRTVSEAVAAYWDLYLAEEIYKIREKSLDIAQVIFRDDIERFKTGKVPETEVFEAQAGVAVRKSLLREARQAIISAKNHMLALFSSTGVQQNAELWSLDKIKIGQVKPDFSESVQKALQLKPEYLSDLRKVKREGIKLEFLKNQRWPELDLKGSYGLNGLSASFSSSWNDAMANHFTSWSIGLELKFPLGGGMKSKSEMEAAKQRKKQAILQLKAAEVSIVNNLDTAIGHVRSASNQVAYYTKAADIYRKLLTIEMARLAAGQSNSRITLQREEDLVKARESEIQSLVNYKRAILRFEVARGSVLADYGIEPKKKDS